MFPLKSSFFEKIQYHAMPPQSRARSRFDRPRGFLLRGHQAYVTQNCHWAQYTSTLEGMQCLCSTSSIHIAWINIATAHRLSYLANASCSETVHLQHVYIYSSSTGVKLTFFLAHFIPIESCFASSVEVGTPARSLSTVANKSPCKLFIEKPLPYAVNAGPDWLLGGNYSVEYHHLKVG